RDLCSGPGKLAQALGITGAPDAHPLDAPPLFLLEGGRGPPSRIVTRTRVGITRAHDLPPRFCARGKSPVSRREPAPGTSSAPFREDATRSRRRQYMSTVPGPRPDGPLPRPGAPERREAPRESEPDRRETAPARETPEWMPEPYDPEREIEPAREPAAVP